jgi:N-methylhydantoinase B/oxoprolinase/acetone carboxylase alpha subunit
MAALEASLILNGSSIAASANYDIKADDRQCSTINATWTSTTASHSLQLQYSFDGSTYINDGSAQAISNNSGSKTWAPTYIAPYYRIANTRTSGTVTTLVIHAVYKPF